MKTSEAVRKIMANDGIGVKVLSDRMGKSMRMVSDRLRQDNISIEKLNEIVQAMGYEIILAPYSTPITDKMFKIE